MDCRLVKWPYDQGEIIGWNDGSVNRATGIAYARAGRFEYPTLIKNNRKQIKATQLSPMAPQKRGVAKLLGPQNFLEMTEACQNLSITLPADHQATDPLLPVMVWFHGGGYEVGAGDLEIYYPKRLVEEQRVLVVNLNYRLGILGFSRDREGQPANLGLLDQLMALRWIKKHIKQFGGDPNNVTLFGQSAGADAIMHLMVAEGSKGLFQRVIIQSAPISANKKHGRIHQELLQASQQITDEMSLEEVITFQTATLMKLRQGFQRASFLPVAVKYGIYPLPKEKNLKEAYRLVAKDFDVLIGSNNHEADFVLSQDRYFKQYEKPIIGRLLEVALDFFTEIIFEEEIDRYAELLYKAGGRVATYLFRGGRGDHIFEGVHMAEIPLLFHAESIKNGLLYHHYSTEDLVKLGKPLRKIWADFAKSGEIYSTKLPDLIEIKSYQK